MEKVAWAQPESLWIRSPLLFFSKEGSVKHKAYEKIMTDRAIVFYVYSDVPNKGYFLFYIQIQEILICHEFVTPFTRIISNLLAILSQYLDIGLLKGKLAQKLDGF